MTHYPTDINNINNIINYSGEWISVFFELLGKESQFFEAVAPETYSAHLDALKWEQIHGEDNESTRSEIQSVQQFVREVTARAVECG